jgi:hypothetical protein
MEAHNLTKYKGMNFNFLITESEEILFRKFWTFRTKGHSSLKALALSIWAFTSVVGLSQKKSQFWSRCLI